MTSGYSPFFNENKFLWNGESIVHGRLLYHPELGCGRQFRLFVGADPDIGGPDSRRDCFLLHLHHLFSAYVCQGENRNPEGERVLQNQTSVEMEIQEIRNLTDRSRGRVMGDDME